MARLTFIFKNTIHFFSSEKALTILILLGMVICDTIFLVFGNVFWSDTRNNDYKVYENNVVTFRFDTMDIDDFLNRTGKKDYIKSTFFEHTVYRNDGTPLTISAYSPMLDIPKSRIEIGHGLKDSNSMEFVMSDTYVMDRSLSELPIIKINDNLHFLDRDWKCRGIVRTSEADGFDILITISDFKSHVKNNITSSFRFSDGTSLIEIQNFANTLKTEFNAESVVTPSKTVRVSFSEFLSDMSGMLILLVIAIINYMFLYRFLLTKRTYAYGIFKLYGMNNYQTLIGLCVEMLAFLIVSFTSSLLLYCGGLLLFGQTGPVFDHMPEFVFAFIIIAVLNSVFFGITAMKFIRSSPTELIRESVVN